MFLLFKIKLNPRRILVPWYIMWYNQKNMVIIPQYIEVHEGKVPENLYFPNNNNTPSSKPTIITTKNGNHFRFNKPI